MIIIDCGLKKERIINVQPLRIAEEIDEISCPLKGETKEHPNDRIWRNGCPCSCLALILGYALMTLSG